MHLKRLLIASSLLTALPGCAFHYFDPETGTEHLWGIGHLKMKVAPPREDVRGVVRGTETVGLAFGTTPHGGFASVGWQEFTTLEVVNRDTELRLEWPSNDLFELMVGSRFPHVRDEPKNED